MLVWVRRKQLWDRRRKAVDFGLTEHRELLSVVEGEDRTEIEQRSRIEKRQTAESTKLTGSDSDPWAYPVNLIMGDLIFDTTVDEYRIVKTGGSRQSSSFYSLFY